MFDFCTSSNSRLKIKSLMKVNCMVSLDDANKSSVMAGINLLV